jgi:hypothetical protein
VKEVFAHFIDRQDYETELVDSGTISRSIPDRMAYALHCPFPDAAMKAYKDLSKKYSNDLYTMDNNGIRLSSLPLRGLFVLAMNPFYEHSTLLMNPQHEVTVVGFYRSLSS